MYIYKIKGLILFILMQQTPIHRLLVREKTYGHLEGCYNQVNVEPLASHRAKKFPKSCKNEKRFSFDERSVECVRTTYSSSCMSKKRATMSMESVNASSMPRIACTAPQASDGYS